MRTCHKRIIATALLLFVMLGFLSFATGVRTVTTSSVTLITVTATKIYTTTMVMGGEVAEMTVEHPSAVRIFLEKRSDQVCVLRVTPLQQGGLTITVPGTTFAFPGTTSVFSTVIDRPTVVTTWATTEKGYTITTRGINIDDYALETTITMPGFTTTYSIPIPVYAETIRECSDVVVIYEETQILEKAPATLVFAIGFPGRTIMMSETTFTISPMEMPTPLAPTTKTTTIKGETTRYTTTHTGTTYTTTISIEPTTLITVVTEEEVGVVTSTIVITTTIEEETGPGTTLATTITEITTPATTVTEKTTEAPRAALPLPMDVLIIAIVSVVSIGVIVALLLRPRLI